MFPDFAGFAHLRAHNRKYIEPNVQNYLRRGNEALNDSLAVTGGSSLFLSRRQTR